MRDEFTDVEKAIISQTEAMYSVNKIPFVVNPHIYSLMIEKMGKEWCKKYLYKDKLIKRREMKISAIVFGVSGIISGIWLGFTSNNWSVWIVGIIVCWMVILKEK